MDKLSTKSTSVKKMRRQDYYQAAHQGSLDLSHPAIQLLQAELASARHVLDLGCGDGTRLAVLIKESHVKLIETVGVDLSSLAIKLASQQYPQLKFVQADLARLPFKNNQFDLAYCAFVLEHLDQPEKVIEEARRVLKKGGKLIMVAPNFGAPNRRSPNSKEGKLAKLLTGLIRDLAWLLQPSLPQLFWTKVEPKSALYQVDADTTVEPYLSSLVRYGNWLGLTAQFASSFWQIDRFSLLQVPFRMLGQLGIYPFSMWGPHLCLVVKK